MHQALSPEREATSDAQLSVSSDPTICYCSSVARSFEQARAKDRHISVLHMIPESEFQRGIESLQKAVDTIGDTTWWCYQGVTITTAIKP